MRGLLAKDGYIIFKQLKFFLVLIVAFAVIPNSSLSGFSIVYTAMLPMTVMAYDEQSKWDKLARMMPYSNRDLVLSKYAIGYIGMMGATLITFISALVCMAFGDGTASERLPAILISMSGGLLLEAIGMPMMLRFGVEKGRILFFIIAIAVTIASIVSNSDSIGRDLHMPAIPGLPLLLLVTAATVVLNLISIAISTRLYRTKEI